MPRYKVIKNKGKLRDPIIANKVITMSASGKEDSEIVDVLAKEDGIEINKSNICRFRNREDVQKAIERETYKLMELVPKAVSNVKTLVDNFEGAEDKDDRKLGYEATKEVLKAAKMLPSSGDTHITTLIFGGVSGATIDPVIAELLELRKNDMKLSPEDMKALGYENEDNITDAEFEEVSDNG